MTPEIEPTGACHYCGQKITLTDCGYDDFWCADPPGGLGTAVCPARDDDRHWPGPDPEDDDLSTPGPTCGTCEWEGYPADGCPHGTTPASGPWEADATPHIDGGLATDVEVIEDQFATPGSPEQIVAEQERDTGLTRHQIAALIEQGTTLAEGGGDR